MRPGGAERRPRRGPRIRLIVWAALGAALLGACGLSATPTRSPGAAPPTGGAMVSRTIRVPSGQGEAASTVERELSLPAGFRIAVYAAGMGRARFMAWSPEGALVISEMAAPDGKVLVWTDRDRDGTADAPVIFARGLRNPHGLAFRDGYLYIAEEHRVVRLRWQGGVPAASEPETVIPDLPTGGHGTRTIGFGPDGKLYLAIGSSCNVCVEADRRRATITQYSPDGSGGRVYASGLRNAVGFVWQPGSGDLWATNNGRDLLGDDLPPETINRVRDGDDFG